MAWSSERLKDTGNSHDRERALIIDAMLAARGEDIPFPSFIPVGGDIDTTVDQAAPMVAAVFHTHPGPVTRRILQEQTGFSPTPVKRVVSMLLREELILEGEPVQARRIGRAAQTFLMTPKFEERISEDPRWRRAVRMRQVMIATGFNQDEVIDRGLELVLQQYVASPVSDPGASTES
jgi:hypothetical protein